MDPILLNQMVEEAYLTTYGSNGFHFFEMYSYNNKIITYRTYLNYKFNGEKGLRKLSHAGVKYEISENF
jgi:hypothetical protein